MEQRTELHLAPLVGSNINSEPSAIRELHLKAISMVHLQHVSASAITQVDKCLLRKSDIDNAGKGDFYTYSARHASDSTAKKSRAERFEDISNINRRYHHSTANIINKTAKDDIKAANKVLGPKLTKLKNGRSNNFGYGSVLTAFALDKIPPMHPQYISLGLPPLTEP